MRQTTQSVSANGGFLNRRAFLVGTSALVAVTACASPTSGPAGSGPRIATTGGILEGVTPEPGVSEFLGVRYAKPPLGALRFQAPQEIGRPAHIVPAKAYGEAAVQMRSGAGAVAYPPVIQAAMTEAFMPPPGIKAEGDEDCLFLNVYTPETAPGSGKLRPVMVWLHGGGYSYGQAGLNIYRGRNLAKNHDVVFVGVNHRLNVFGFLGLDNAGVLGFEGSANAGMLDLVMALRWVQDNIEQFGGDPANVTIFGQSGGGLKVSLLLAMPEANGLFQKAIIQSGAGLRAGSKESSIAAAEGLLKKLGISEAEAAEKLAALSTEDIVKAANEIGVRAFRPSIDDVHIPRHPFSPDAPAQAAEIPVMIGYTKDEQTLYNIGSAKWFETTDADVLAAAERSSPGHGQALVDEFTALYPDYGAKHLMMQVTGTYRSLQSSYTLASRKSEQAAPVYAYVFAHDIPPQDFILKAPHTAEIPYIMDNVEEAPLFAGATEDDLAMGDLMSNVWTRFARTGDPNGPDLPVWPKFNAETRPTMFFKTESEVITNPYPATWSAIQATLNEDAAPL